MKTLIRLAIAGALVAFVYDVLKRVAERETDELGGIDQPEPWDLSDPDDVPVVTTPTYSS